MRLAKCTCIALWLFMTPGIVLPQGTVVEYERARNLKGQTQGLVYDSVERVNWIEWSHRFWYRKTVKGGSEFFVVDADTLTKQRAFDHDRLAAGLSAASGRRYTGRTLPFTSFAFVDFNLAVEFAAGDARWKCDLYSYACSRVAGAGAAPAEDRSPVIRAPAPDGSPAGPAAAASPNQRWEAFVRNFNVWVRERESGKESQLSWDGSESDCYSGILRWSPDSKKLAAFRTLKGSPRLVHYVESSPADQIQPRYSAVEYAKPGDVIDVNMPALFHVEEKTRIPIDNRLFKTPFGNGQLRWRRDSRAFTFEYNQRGHQVYRVIEVDAQSGKARVLIQEETPTFFCYSSKRFRFDLDDGREIIWMSERDGWNHLYLYDGAAGTVKNQITRGPWVVRGVDRIEESRRQIWFRASGMVPGQDPYFVHYYRINFDGTGLVAFTQADADHAIYFTSGSRGAADGRAPGGTSSFSDDMLYYVDSYSRVDLPPVLELHRAADQKKIMEVERADMQDLLKSGWIGPESFSAKGRDGRTDIWGVIWRPRNFDPTKKYPVVEYIYAGPQDSYVPKTFSAYNPMQSLAELGFIVVQIDGMGTNNRSKAFHDVAWKNLGDGGFADRILWHKAVARKYPYYDISRVGIFGSSAGGQNSLGALLFHPEFYQVAVSSSGCHDNRLDKIWWNEQWMGFPVGPEYAASSNVVNAYRLQGKLLLVAGELDTNVDPSATYQVANALIKAGKDFDFLLVPGGDHSTGGEYADRKRNDFFVRHLLGVAPPDWNVTTPAGATVPFKIHRRDAEDAEKNTLIPLRSRRLCAKKTVAFSCCTGCAIGA